MVDATGIYRWGLILVHWKTFKLIKTQIKTQMTTLRESTITVNRIQLGQSDIPLPLSQFAAVNRIQLGQ